MIPHLYKFNLFVAGTEPNSVIARRNLESICRKHLADRNEVVVTDVLKEAGSAYENGVVVTPTLLAEFDGERILVVGNLTNSERVFAALRLPPPETPE